MAEHPNAVLIRRAYQAFAERDVATIVELTAEDAAWHIPGRNPIAGTYRGRDNILAFLARLMELTEGTISFEVHDVVANSEHAIAMHRGGGSRPDGRPNDDQICMVFHIRDGRVTEAWYHAFDQHAVDDFWA